jgi:DNA-binding response OmpR family regulator
MANVLLVDDDVDVLATVADAVKSEGHDVTMAASGLAALDFLDTGAPLDLMITDVIMPGLNGFNLARMAVSRRPSLRVLYLSGYSESEVMSRDLGGRHGKMLMKPLLMSELRLEIEAALSNRSKRGSR